MKLLLFVFLLGGLTLSAAEIVLYKPVIQLAGKRISNKRTAIPGSGIVSVEKVPEAGVRFIFYVRNKSGNILRLATRFNHVRFESEPGKNQFVLQLSHRILQIRPEPGAKPFPLIQPVEAFQIVTLRPGEGTLINALLWLPEGKLRSGDKLVIEYAPRNSGRYDFLQMTVRSTPVEFKWPVKNKAVAPVEI